MLDSNIILDTRGHFNCEEYEHGILVQNWEHFPLGTPVVYPKGSLDTNKSDITRVLTLLSPSANSAGVDYSNVHTNIIVPVDLKPLCKYHRVLTVSQFDIGKFGRLTEFVHDVGGISIVIEHTEGRDGIVKSIKELERFFKYTTLFCYNAWSAKQLSGADDHYICVLTFLDLPYCIPLFNTHKVDGIGLSFSGALHKASVNKGFQERIFRADIIYSNYEDNVLVIDGVDANSYCPPQGDTYAELSAMARQTLKVASKDEYKKKKSSGYGKYVLRGESETVALKEPYLKSPPSDWAVNFNETITVGVDEGIPDDEPVEMPQPEVETAPDAENVFADVEDVFSEAEEVGQHAHGGLTSYGTSPSVNNATIDGETALIDFSDNVYYTTTSNGVEVHNNNDDEEH